MEENCFKPKIFPQNEKFYSASTNELKMFQPVKILLKDGKYKKYPLGILQRHCVWFREAYDLNPERIPISQHQDLPEDPILSMFNSTLAEKILNKICKEVFLKRPPVPEEAIKEIFEDIEDDILVVLDILTLLGCEQFIRIILHRFQAIIFSVMRIISNTRASTNSTPDIPIVVKVKLFCKIREYTFKEELNTKTFEELTPDEQKNMPWLRREEQIIDNYGAFLKLCKPINEKVINEYPSVEKVADYNVVNSGLQAYLKERVEPVIKN